VDLADTLDGRNERRVMRGRRRWRIVSLTLAVFLFCSWGWMASRWPTVAQTEGAAAIVAASQRADESAAYRSEQAKAELRLLRKALDAAKEVDTHHRHHSQVMWNLLQGKITSQEAWWQGGDSTCAGWLAANEYEEAVGKLEGRKVQPKPIPAQGLAFCKAARERR
jgi:hypothetical protein